MRRKSRFEIPKRDGPQRPANVTAVGNPFVKADPSSPGPRAGLVDWLTAGVGVVRLWSLRERDVDSSLLHSGS
jgi:hypothetical protein